MTDELDDIPAFLLRNPDNTIPDVRPPAVDALRAVGKSPVLAMPYAAAPSRKEVADVYAEIAATAKQKSYGRLGKMKAKQADKAAVKAGKVWDAEKAEWK